MSKKSEIKVKFVNNKLNMGYFTKHLQKCPLLHFSHQWWAAPYFFTTCIERMYHGDGSMQSGLI